MLATQCFPIYLAKPILPPLIHTTLSPRPTVRARNGWAVGDILSAATTVEGV